MLAHEHCDTALHRGAVAQSSKDGHGRLRSLLRMPGKANVAIVELVTRVWLGDVVQQRAPANREGDVGVRIEFLGERRGDRGRCRSERELRMLDQIDGGVEHLQRVIKHIEVVIAILLDALERLHLRQDDHKQAQLI